MNDVKQQVLKELDTRIAALQEHEDDEVVETDNQYEVLNQAIKKVIGVPLRKELEDLKTFVSGL